MSLPASVVNVMLFPEIAFTVPTDRVAAACEDGGRDSCALSRTAPPEEGDNKSARPSASHQCCGSSLPFRSLKRTGKQRKHHCVRIPGTRHIPFDNYTYLSS